MDRNTLPQNAAFHWSLVGERAHHGIVLPLFSLRSENSSGIGEFTDLLPMIEWCQSIGWDVIQLLPINDTGRESSPYSALSANALNPIYLGLSSLPHVMETPSLKKQLKPLQYLTDTARIPYQEVFEKREAFLREYFSLHAKPFLSSFAYKNFIDQHSWLHAFAEYKALKIAHDWKSWESWPRFLERPVKEEIDYHLFIQFLCFKQFAEVKAHAKKHGVLLKGDIPILISRDSADVWHERTLFRLDLSAGAPPDMFSAEGQNWGFPLYKWEEIEKNDFAWWRERLRVASVLYDLYRLDHAVGFFRIWGVPLGMPARSGRFVPEEVSSWAIQGEGILKRILQMSPMLPIAEDLGVVPDEARAILRSLQIPGTKVMRWERAWKQDKRFLSPKEYPPYSMTCVSTHDSETLALWWMNNPEDVRTLCTSKGWTFTYEPSINQLKEILYDCHHSRSLFHINLLQEYLQLVPHLSWINPEDERINIPGTISDKNWTYRFRPYVEEIVKNPQLHATMRGLIKETLP